MELYDQNDLKLKNKIKYLLFIYFLTFSINLETEAYCNRIRPYTEQRGSILNHFVYNRLRACVFDLGIFS